jgi:DNA polymerase IIIc chi subunit
MTGCVFHDTEPSLQDRRLFELVEASYAKRGKVVIFAHSVERAAAIDRFLWILKQEAFIPHAILKEGDSGTNVPVAIVTSESNPIGARVLIADGHCSLGFAFGFDFIHEFVRRSSLEIQEVCRERFRSYRARRASVEYQK